MAFDLGLSQLAIKVLFVVGVQSLWVGITDKTIGTAGHSCPLITSWQSLIYNDEKEVNEFLFIIL